MQLAHLLRFGRFLRIWFAEEVKMVRPVGVFLFLFALLSLIVHQIGMFEFLTATAASVLLADLMVARLSGNRRHVSPSLREPLL